MNERNSSEQGFVEVDIQKLLLAYLKKWWLILVLAAIGVSAMYLYTTYYVTPMYRASTTIYVNNNRSEEKSDYVSSGDLATSERLVSTYTNMITSDTVLSKVIDTTGYHYSTDQLRGMTTSSQVGGTEIFKVYVTHADPEIAANIANAIAYTAPEVIADFVEGSSTKIIDYAKVPSSPSSPNVKRNLTIGGACGAILAFAILTLQFLLDVRIKEDEDLRALCDLPILGQIPDFDEFKGKGAHEHKKNGYDGYDNSGDGTKQ